MRRSDQKNFGVNINSALADNFSDQVESRGQKKFRAIEGAIKLWLNLPNEVQALLISNPDPELRKICNILSRRIREGLSNALAREEQFQQTRQGKTSKVPQSRNR